MKYLAAFASSASLEGFRLPEFISVAAALDVPVTLLDDDIPWVAHGGDSFWFSVFESAATLDQLSKLAARCILLRGIYLLFETAPTLEDFYACLDARSGAASSGASATAASYRAFAGESHAPQLSSSSGYCYQVETIGRKYTDEAKRAVVEAVLRRVPLQGKVEWHSPQRRFFVFLQHAVESALAGAQGWVPNGPLLRVFHCCLCVESGRRALLATYDLKKRPYIGTTSMPPEESMVMANMSCVRRGHLVYDPFCGTGSLLVAAAHCGAMTVGSDADGRAMRAGTEKGKTSPQMQQQRRLALANYSPAQLEGLTEEERLLPNMWTNFKLYGLPPPDRARMNFSAWPHTWHTAAAPDTGAIFDSVISDPPYGLREPRKKVEMSATAAAAVTLSAYATSEVVLDLVLFAAAHLAMGGYLTFWHPTTDHYTDDELPAHPSLRVLHDIPQRVSLKIVRRLIVMRKVAPLPSPPPSRESCAAKRAPEDLRKLMDATALPDNAEYTHYRARRERRRQAAQQFQASAPASEDGSSGGGGVGNRRGRKQNRLDAQEEVVANRQRNIEVREAKQAASHLANAAHKARTGDA
ncbi:methyltransferase-like protein [Leptomonas pyrrhocoris]|uniref:Methyltransferase-like protein n=1 Tax=Leptomonas pyrrhocoris TaxID=157538 RepID=A0A0N0VCS5_LEPPY|nr:methyltransferase-like protein [Leptomonas pyrrhocoris]KPA73401.1 methyltransferase-like protein [Leptomonas pyrrhocoris]|eukprot:XP_015651840.1 methyltransferase-like protein [Leptomonas pyrrhocoris]